jgi:hypothetical protein
MPKLNDNQLKQLADFTSNLSLVFFTTVIAPVFSEIDRVNPLMIVLGIGLTVSCILASMQMLNKK